MPELSQDTWLYAAGGLFALAILLFVVSLHLFRRSRRDVFWRRRREAGQRGWRIFMLAFVLLVFSGLICGSTLLARMMIEDAAEDATTSPTPHLAAGATLTPALILPSDTLEPVAAILPTDTPTSVVLALESPTPAPPEPTATSAPASAVLPTNPPPATVIVVVTATPGGTPTQTPFPTFTPNGRPLASDVTPAPNARLQITALDDEVSASLLPVNPSTTFQAGIERIYLFVTFENMTQGVLWRRELYRDGQLIDGSSYLWGLPTSGRTSFFFGSDTGFGPGSYEVRLYLGNSTTPVSRMAFTIAEPDAE